MKDLPPNNSLRKWVDAQPSLEAALPTLKQALTNAVMAGPDLQISSLDVAQLLGEEHDKLRPKVENYFGNLGFPPPTGGIGTKTSPKVVWLTPEDLAGYLMSRPDKFGVWLGKAALSLIREWAIGSIVPEWIQKDPWYRQTQQILDNRRRVLELEYETRENLRQLTAQVHGYFEHLEYPPPAGVIHSGAPGQPAKVVWLTPEDLAGYHLGSPPPAGGCKKAHRR